VLFKGKGDKQRIIPLSKSTLRALGEYLQKRLPASSKNKHIFLNNRGEPITPRGVQLLFKRICKEAEILRPELSVHKLRHTCLTLLLREGVDIVTLKEIAGHDDIGSTEIYLHVTDEEVRLAVKKHPLG